MMPSMTREIALCSVMFLVACAATGGNPTVNLRTVNSGSYSEATQRAAVAAFDDETFRKTWTTMIGGSEMPSIDFSREAVVFLFAGTRNTGGYAVEPRSVSVEGETLIVDAGVKGPPRDAMVTQVITSPYAVIAVDSRNFKDVRWTP